jgi:hypothetical protein
MSRSVHTPTPRFPRALLGLALLAGLASAPLHAQKASSACELLQVAEVEAALGAKALAKPSGTKQSTPGMTVDVCNVNLSGNHDVSVQIVTNLGTDSAQLLAIRNNATASEPQWKRAGARLEQSTVGKAICILSARPSAASSAICSIPRGQGYVEVQVTGTLAGLPTLTTIAGLVQKANSRL